MHTVIRRYEGAGDSAEVCRRAVAEFGPMLRDRPGFQGYYVVDAGDGVLATISVFDSEEAALETIPAGGDRRQHGRRRGGSACLRHSSGCSAGIRRGS